MSLQAEEIEMIMGLRRTMTVKQVAIAVGLSEFTIQKYSKGLRAKRYSSENRQKLEILRDILMNVKEMKRGLRRTRIMYSANLSCDLLKQYLNICLSNGFLQEEEGFYHITLKGNKYLKRYQDLMKLFKFKSKEGIKE